MQHKSRKCSHSNLTQAGSSTEHRIKSLIETLQHLTYNYVCRSLFKADRLMFALHMAHGMFSDLFNKDVRSSARLIFYPCLVFRQCVCVWLYPEIQAVCAILVW